MTHENFLPFCFIKRSALNKKLTFAHDSFDFIYILSGQLQILCQDTSLFYTNDDFTFIPANTQCTLLPKGDCELLFFGLNADFINDALAGYTVLICDSVREPLNDYTKLRRLLLTSAAESMENSSENQLALRGYACLIADEIKKKHCALSAGANASDKFTARTAQLLAYIDTHYQEPISLTETAKAFYLTPQYLSAFFSKHMHTNFKDFLTEKRLSHAKRQLRYTNDSITEIAIHCGFSNSNVFYKNFCRFYKESPLSYRKRYQNSGYTGNNFASKTLPEVMSVSSKRSPDTRLKETGSFSQNITVAPNQCACVPFSLSCTLINVGSAVNLLSTVTQKQLLDACTNLGFRYVRLQEVISSAFIPMTLPHMEYYFQHVSTVINFLYAHKLIPFIELSRRFSFHDTVSDFPSVSTGSRFFQLFENFLIYCSRHWPRTWLSEWKFEFWFSSKDPVSKYLSDFCRIQTLLHKYFPEAALGGPGFSPCFSPYEIETVLKAFIQKQLRPDFISIYLNLSFKNSDSNSPLCLSTDKDFLINNCEKIRQCLQTYFPEVPLYATEWQSAFIPSLPLSYSCFQAAFICRSLPVLSSMCQMIGYWLLNDEFHTSDIFSQPSINFWGQGLFYRSEIASPAYYALKFMNGCGKTLIQKGENYLVTQIEKGHFQIIAVNYAHIASFQAIIEKQTHDFEKVYELFEEKPDIDFCLKLSGIEKGLYKITRHFLDNYHGSYLDILIGEYTHSHIKRTDFLQYAKMPFDAGKQYRLRACLPEERVIYAEVTDSLLITSKIPKHCICVWNIRQEL